MRFKDKVVLVLGGNSGIGLAAARAFAAEGATVHFTGRSWRTIEVAQAAIPGSTGYQSDIADPAATEDLIARVEAADGRIDVLFINAGVGGFAPLREITEDAWDHIHDINLRGCVFALQKAVRIMGRGSSVVVRVFAREPVGEGMRVNVVSPGPIDTPLLYRNPGMGEDAVAKLKEMMIANIPMHRMGESDEVAKAVLFLASDEAAFVTGANLFVDGGLIELR